MYNTPECGLLDVCSTVTVYIKKGSIFTPPSLYSEIIQLPLNEHRDEHVDVISAKLVPFAKIGLSLD